MFQVNNNIPTWTAINPSLTLLITCNEFCTVTKSLSVLQLRLIKYIVYTVIVNISIPVNHIMFNLYFKGIHTYIHTYMQHTYVHTYVHKYIYIYI